MSRSVLAVITLGVAVAAAGCGGSDGPGSATAAGSTPPAAAVATTPPPTSPAPAEANATTTPSPHGAKPPSGDEPVPTSGSQDFSASAAARGDHVEQVPAADGLSLSSPARAGTAWSLTAKSADGDVFCVDVHSKGLTDPDPLCNSGTQLALSFFTDQTEGHALADVDSIAASKRAKPTDLVVAGVAAPDVKDVVVFFRGQRHAAAVTRQGVTLKVDKQLAKQILDPTPEQLRTLPSTVTVRVFAVSMPSTGVEPPKTATPRTLTPVNGRMTFDLS